MKGRFVRKSFAFLWLLILLVGVGSSLRAQKNDTAQPKATATATPKITKPVSAKTLTLQPITATVPLYGRVELQLATDLTVDNPFDPAQADLWVNFKSPTGQVSRVPAFWYQEYERNTLRPHGKADWRVRFTPNEVGTWQAQAEIGKLQSKPLTFTVQSSTAPGFVRINPQNSHYFAFDNGDLYLPIGLNIGWATQQGSGTLRDYERWFDHLRANGGNVARIWMADWSFGLEWNDTPLGDYSHRLDRAWLLDQVFAMAEERQIKIMLTLLHHGPFSTSVNPQWNENPYNVANGGMLKSPGDFVSNPQAKELFKRRLRYIAARWGYSTSLLAWEWWNEVELTPISDQVLIPWSAEMAKTLAGFDPYDHLLTSSYANGRGHQLWASPEIDFTQQHDYTANDPIEEFADTLQSIHKIAPDKPILLAEHGFSTGGADSQSLETEIIHFHNGIWAAPFLGYAGSAMYWWWDSFVDPQAQWVQYQSLAQFVAGEDLTALQPTTLSGQGYKALLLHSETTALVWMRSDQYNAAAVSERYNADILKALKEKRKLTDWKFEPTTINGATLALSGLQDGSYQAQWYDPQNGVWTSHNTVEVKDSKAELSLTAFNKDLALKLTAK